MITINIAPKTGTVSPPLQQQEIDFRKIKIKDTISFTIGSIPNFSSDTISILKNHSFEFTDIKKCAERMFNMTERFASAKENSTKHKIFCFLKTTLITSVIVVGILGCLALASVGAEVATVFVGLAVYFISGGLGALYGTDAGVIFSCDLSYLLPIACIISGPVFPIRLLSKLDF